MQSDICLICRVAHSGKTVWEKYTSQTKRCRWIAYIKRMGLNNWSKRCNANKNGKSKDRCYAYGHESTVLLFVSAHIDRIANHSRLRHTAHLLVSGFECHRGVHSGRMRVKCADGECACSRSV